MKNIFYSIIMLLLVIGCNTTVKNKPIYFGGQIKNPKDNSISIFKNHEKIATAKLNHNNKFLFKLDSINDDLYTFKHGEEFQYIYLQQKDSLLIRFNSWDFDESLVFSGKGANRNNLLIQLFLENEQEERQFYNYFKLNESDFMSKVDSLIQLKKTQLKHFKENSVQETDHFNELISDIIHLPIYANKEEYPLHYKKQHQLKKLPQLSKSFYSHRQIIENKKTIFKDYYAYKSYLWSKIYNTAFFQFEKDTLNELSAILLTKINSLVPDEKLKNSMLKKTYINSLFDSSCSDKNKEKTKALFFKNCNDTTKTNTVTRILQIINTLEKNKKLPEFYLKNTNNRIINSNNLIGENMVIYFWPKELNRIQNMAKRVNFLTNKHSNIRFIGIDGQLDNYNWKAYAKANNLNLTNQFQLIEPNKHVFYTNDFPRAIIIDKKGIIKNNFTFISNSNFEQLLQSL